MDKRFLDYSASRGNNLRSVVMKKRIGVYVKIDIMKHIKQKKHLK